MICPLTIRDVLRAAAIVAGGIMAIAAGLSCIGAAEVELHAAVNVPLFQPVTIRHDDGDRVAVERFDTHDPIPESQIDRKPTVTTFAAESGVYLVSIGDRYRVVKIGTIPPTPVPDPAPNELTETKTIEPEPPAPEAKYNVWVYVADNCPPCDTFKETDAPVLKSKGVTVHVVTDHDEPSAPTFILSAPGKTAVKRVGRHDGWTDADGILAFMGL